jgi:prepilin-type N-terminal cleavage/methylation domain-containing protein
MTNLMASRRRSEEGFTLVELAIVMVIIGLLIGGILKGQELIATAKVGATVSQIKALDGAINTFQEKYSAYPGDMRSPNTRIPNCTQTPCSTPGDGNMRIVNSATLGDAPQAGSEGTRIFSHLAKADLLSGVDGDSAVVNAFGELLPVVKAGGGMWINFLSGPPGGDLTLTPGRHYAVINGTAVAVGADTGGFNSSVAAQLDRKMDDGKPVGGGVQIVGSNCVSGSGQAALYHEATPGPACAMYVRILN